MKGRTNCGFSGGGNVKYIPSCATLTILAPTDATVQVSKGSFSKTLDNTYKDKIVDIYDVYKYYVRPSEFGTWNVTIAFDGTSRSTSVVVDETEEYKVNTVLPVEYQHITYIGSSTTDDTSAEKINTGTIPTSNTAFSCHYLILPGNDYNATSWRSFIGVNGDDGKTTSCKTQQYYSTCTLQIGISGQYTEMSNTGLDAGSHYVKIDLKHGIGINDNLTKTLNMGSLDFNQPIGIVRSQYDATAATWGAPYMKIQDSRIYEDDILIQYFIPCYRRSDSVIGMYELINDQFYITSGTTGGFTKGPDLTF